MSEARLLMAIEDILDKQSPEVRHRMVVYLVSKYGVMPGLSREYERQRKADAREIEKAIQLPVPDNVPEPVPEIVRRDGVSPAPVVHDRVLELLLEKARTVLEAKDFEFLSLCPEPFRRQWLKDPQWWVSVKDGYDKLDMLTEASKCMGYVQGKFSAAQQERLNLRERLRRWLAKAEAWRENREERRAVRR